MGIITEMIIRSDQRFPTATIRGIDILAKHPNLLLLLPVALLFFFTRGLKKSIETKNAPAGLANAAGLTVAAIVGAEGVAIRDQIEKSRQPIRLE